MSAGAFAIGTYGATLFSYARCPTWGRASSHVTSHHLIAQGAPHVLGRKRCAAHRCHLHLGTMGWWLYASLVRVVGTALFAVFVLQACVSAPSSSDVSPVQAGQDEQRTPVQLTPPPAQVAPSPTSRELPALPAQVAAKLRRAQVLEKEASDLDARADFQEQWSGSARFGGHEIVAPAVQGPGAVYRSRAQQLRDEAAELHRQAEEESYSLGADRSHSHFGSDRAVAAPLNGVIPDSGATVPEPPRLSLTRPSRDGCYFGECVYTPKGKPASLPSRKPSSVQSGAPSEYVPTPAESFAAESGKIDGLVKGSVAVSAPACATTGDQFSVYLRVSPEKLESVIQGLKDEFPANQTVKGKRGVRLTPRMTATVSGFGFEVVPKEGQSQAVSATEPTTWSWQVNATESGVQTLTFSLTGTLTIEDKEVPRNFYEYKQNVQVEVDTIGFMEKYWQWIMTTLAFPTIGGLWKWFQKPKDPAGSRQPSIIVKLRERRRLRA